MERNKGILVVTCMIMTLLIFFLLALTANMVLTSGKTLINNQKTSVAKNKTLTSSESISRGMNVSKNEQDTASPQESDKDTLPPIIDHQPIKTFAAFSAIKIQATITDNNTIPTAKLYYKKDKDHKYASVSMEMNSEDSLKFSADIPAMNVESSITYFIEASDGTSLKKTPQYTISIEKQNVDFSKIPMFLVTEIVPDSSDISGVDGYEFIEVYNNSDKDLNFKDYKLLYRLGAEATTDYIWPSTPEDVIIKSKGTLVFWILNDKNKHKKMEDFNKHYHTSLVENEDIVRIYNASISNNGLHGIVVADNTKQEISVAYYNEHVEEDDTKTNKAILYNYPQDSSTNSIKVSAGAVKGTPGSVDREQVPETPIHIVNDRVKPTVKNLTAQTIVKETEGLELTVDAKDDKSVRTVKVYYKANGANAFKSVILKKDFNTLLFQYTIPSPEMIGKETIEYYYSVSDGTNVTISETYKAKVTNDRNRERLRMNVKESQIFSGNTIIKGTSEEGSADDITLLVDNKMVATKTYPSLENTAYLAFDVSNVNLFFKNGVTMGDEILQIFDDLIVDWQTITVPIQPEQLKMGDNVLTIRAGNKATPFREESIENRDDFQVRNVRLVLGDGTIIKDSTHNNSKEIINMNDLHPQEKFHFLITEIHATSKAYNWDTKSLTDGAHTLTVKASNEEVNLNVVVDNTAPAIYPLITKHKQYKGEFVINPVISDEISGVASTEVTLDGTKITTPYQTSSALLSPGEHVLQIKAKDKSGNKNEKEIPFTVVGENPRKPEAEIPVENADGTMTLRVKVTDPTSDDMNVNFYQALKYKPNDTKNIKAYQGTSKSEPPQTPVPEGEKSVENEALDLVSLVDKKYLTNDSEDAFPYHRFDVTLNRFVDEKDVVELVWKGKSLPGRKVTMYAWSHAENKWKALADNIAGRVDFTLIGKVNVSEYVKNNKINVIVQDEIPASANDYDYTFVWMSDTQYYSKFYPHIFDSQTQWIAQNKDAMKIKYVFHTGDLVEESNKEDQWRNADQFMKRLETVQIPYGVLAGNHDVDHKTSDYTQFGKYFGAERFKDKYYYGESYQNNRGHYDLISVDGNDYIMVYMGWGVNEEGITWINQILAAHPDRKAIINFHEYLMASGTRHPNGEILYKNIVRKNPNVIAVLSGHYHESQTLIDEIDDNQDGITDRKVYQLLADYQSGPEGGQGYMRLLHIDQKNNRIMVNTYSPYMNDYNYFNPDAYPSKDEFVINLDMQPMKKRVSTDYFEVNVYSDSQIGKAEKVKSGEHAVVKWSPLSNMNSWYVIVTDQFTGKTVSDVWSFETNE